MEAMLPASASSPQIRSEPGSCSLGRTGYHRLLVTVRQEARSLPVSVPALIAAFITAADDVLYAVVVRSQGGFQDDRGRVVFVASFVAGLFAVTLAGALVRRPAVRIALLAVATGGLLTLGLLGMASIGLPLAVAGVLTAVAWSRAWGDGQPASVKAVAVALAMVGPATLIAGIVLT